VIRQRVARVLAALLVSVTAGCAGSAPSEATASHPMSVDPDQAVAAVTDLNGDLWLMTAEGVRLAKLVDIAERIGSPSWAPDGSMLAFDAGSSSFIVDADGTNMRQLAAGVRNPAWSPDGTRLAVSNGQLGLVEADGSGLRFLSPTVPGIHPAWAPDGRSIAYASAGPPFDIWTVRPDGSDVTNLTSSESYDMFPAWSPDGARIAFGADANTSTTGLLLQTEIMVMAADGSDRVNVTRSPDIEGFPQWLPDGRISFTTTTGELWVMGADGSGRRKFASDVEAVAWRPRPRP
jgi:Tol biopolymer transport system component